MSHYEKSHPDGQENVESRKEDDFIELLAFLLSLPPFLAEEERRGGLLDSFVASSAHTLQVLSYEEAG